MLSLTSSLDNHTTFQVIYISVLNGITLWCQVITGVSAAVKYEKLYLLCQHLVTHCGKGHSSTSSGGPTLCLTTGSNFHCACLFLYSFVLCWNSKMRLNILHSTALACRGMIPWVFCSLNTALTDLCGRQQCPLVKNLVSNCRHVCSIIIRYLSSVYLRYHTSAWQNKCCPENVSKQIHVFVGAWSLCRKEL